MFYRWKTGMFAWAMFRITGLALVLYLSMHIFVVSNLHDPAKFNTAMNFLGSWQFRMLEIGLFVAVLYHALNGVRIFMVDFFGAALYQAKLFWTLAAIGAVLFVAGAYPMFNHAMHVMNAAESRTGKIQVTSTMTQPANPLAKSDEANSVCPYMALKGGSKTEPGGMDPAACSMEGKSEDCCKDKKATDANVCPGMGGSH